MAAGYPDLLAEAVGRLVDGRVRPHNEAMRRLCVAFGGADTGMALDAWPLDPADRETLGVFLSGSGGDRLELDVDVEPGARPGGDAVRTLHLLLQRDPGGRWLVAEDRTALAECGRGTEA